MRSVRRSVPSQWGVLVLAVVLVGIAVPALAQQPIEITKTDITKQKTIDASQITVLSVRLGDTKDQALKTLQKINTIKVQEAGPGRIDVIYPATSNSVVMIVQAVEGMVTSINLLNAFGDWLVGDTKLLFRGFQNDSLRYKLIGREDNREMGRGGTKEEPAGSVAYAYYKEGIVLSLFERQTGEKEKKVEAARQMVLMFPARTR